MANIESSLLLLLMMIIIGQVGGSAQSVGFARGSLEPKRANRGDDPTKLRSKAKSKRPPADHQQSAIVGCGLLLRLLLQVVFAAFVCVLHNLLLRLIYALARFFAFSKQLLLLLLLLLPGGRRENERITTQLEKLLSWSNKTRAFYQFAERKTAAAAAARAIRHQLNSKVVYLCAHKRSKDQSLG